jgi:transaldolase
LGQTVWCDNISRDVSTGELKRLIDLGVRGVTSNSILRALSLAGLRCATSRLVGGSRSAQDITKRWLSKISAGHAICYTVFEETGHVDGFVSLEVSPLLSSDAQSTRRTASLPW